jgi:hypothetical protein
MSETSQVELIECSVCLTIKPITEFLFAGSYRRKKACCNECRKAAARERNKRNRHTWPSKSKEARQAEHRKAAEKVWRVYRTLDEIQNQLNSHVYDWRKWRHNQRRDPKQYDAHVAAFNREQYWSAYRLERPWLATRDDTEQCRLRYALDPEFHQRELDKSSNKRAVRGWDYRTQWYLRRVFQSHEDGGDWEHILGYSLDELRAYIESLMPIGSLIQQLPSKVAQTETLTWQQYLDGDVVLDHIKPIRLFNMRDRAQFLQCWALSNLQPLIFHDNQVKAGKYEEQET